jgi:uncharacterized protein YndB with AHSA1/START domain
MIAAMGPVMATITIDAPRERVYDMVADLAMRPAYCDHFLKEFRLQRIEPRGVGAAARFHIAAPRFPIWMETVISELEPPHLLLESGRGSRIDRMTIGTAWELVETSGNMCDVTVSFWTEPQRHTDKLKDRLASSGWYERQWKRALTRLRDLAEADAEIEPLRVAGASRP